ncbi:MAG: aminotransferase class III-fold pyridoxal phosphate-dependent enzyme, partial [Verrucomicrobiae bacterium]|nr:aminotransferase class III-fold pyridoxal phosphate-dependent enzyme [Verrucomicrobiae bacterium]
LSACVGKATLMDAAWPKATGEAIHTSTFLGNPVGCAMALAQIDELEKRQLVQRSARVGSRLFSKLAAISFPRELVAHVRGRGLMIGIELRKRDGSPATSPAVSAVKAMLRRGYILLPEGEMSNVLSLTPPLTIRTRYLDKAVEVLEEVLMECVQ